MDEEAETEAEANELIAEIEAAFARVPRGKISLHEARVVDNYGTMKQRLRARKKDPEKRWTEVPDDVIETAGVSAASFLDPAGWKFYLPAFMRWTIRHYADRPGSMLVDQTIYSLGLPPAEDHLHGFHMKHFQTLDERQSRAVCRFLRFMAAQHDHADADFAEQALEAYWARFCPEGGR